MQSRSFEIVSSAHLLIFTIHALNLISLAVFVTFDLAFESHDSQHIYSYDNVAFSVENANDELRFSAS